MKEAVPHFRPFLRKEQLEIGGYYYGSCRNADIARWDGDHFTYARRKFGNRFPEEIRHPEDDDGADLFFPYAKIDAAEYDKI